MSVWYRELSTDVAASAKDDAIARDSGNDPAGSRSARLHGMHSESAGVHASRLRAAVDELDRVSSAIYGLHRSCVIGHPWPARDEFDAQSNAGSRVVGHPWPARDEFILNSREPVRQAA